MATTFTRICIEAYTIVDDDRTFTLTPGTAYITSPDRDGQIQVYAQYWVWVPARIFAGAVQFTGLPVTPPTAHWC